MIENLTQISVPCLVQNFARVVKLFTKLTRFFGFLFQNCKGSNTFHIFSVIKENFVLLTK